MRELIHALIDETWILPRQTDFECLRPCSLCSVDSFSTLNIFPINPLTVWMLNCQDSAVHINLEHRRPGPLFPGDSLLE